MEDVLSVYEEEYDEKKPVVCIDEKPCQIVSDVIKPIKAKEGHPLRIDYEYERKGVCTVFVAIEAKTGKRLLMVRDRRTKNDYAKFMDFVQSKYPHADVIRVVQDNLNTHTIGAFYEAFRAEKAYNLKQRFEFNYTPKHASWLNMAEIEISALSRICLNRRFDDRSILELELKALVKERNKNKVKINWTFTKEKARQMFKKHYR
jgi:hypothetical protein